MRRQDDLNDRLYRLKRPVNRYPHGTVHRRHGFLDSEHEAEAKSNEGMRGDDTAVEESSIHLLNIPVATPLSRHERELRTCRPDSQV